MLNRNSIIKVLLSVLLIFSIAASGGTLTARASEPAQTSITITDGEKPIPGATVSLSQHFDSSLVRQDTVTVEKVGGFSRDKSIQSGAVYGDYFVCVEKGGQTSEGHYTVNFHIYDLVANKRIAKVTMKGDYFHGQYSQYKNNNANFGTTFHDENDPFPLLYISSAYDYRTVAVRIYKDGSTWKVEQMQIFDYYDAMHNDDGFYSCNVLLDPANSHLYLTPIDKIYTAPADKQWFYKFEMPKYEPGSVVTISPDMALAERVETEYEFAPQGCFLMDGKVYQGFGFGSAEQNAKLGIFDLTTGKYETKINLNDLGCAEEPEACAFYKGAVYICSVKGNIWKITPKAYILSEDDLRQDDVLLQSIELNQDKDWEAGFLKTPKSATGTHLGQEIHPNNKIYRTALIDIGDADYIRIPTPNHFASADGGYYKWKIHWYGPNAQLGATTKKAIDFIDYAKEQSDFDTTAIFAVPEGTKYVRVCIASVLKNGTQKEFPESDFLTDGGLQVHLYDSGTTTAENASLWLDASAVTDGSGSIKFRTLPSAVFDLTVSAEGYETVSKVIPASEYASGLTLQLQPMPHQHALTRVEASASTQKLEGNILHWYCQACDQRFSDAEGRYAVDRNAVLLPKLPRKDHTAVILAAAACLLIGSGAAVILIRKRRCR